MSESETASTESDFEAPKALQEDASELERIQNLLDQFNMFETIDFIGQEVMHSRFLAFLLDPKQNHGLGDVLLRKMLEKASAISNVASVLKVFEDIGSRNMEQTAVQTEVYTDDGRIDILLLNEIEKWAMIIENKVWTIEHSDQLNRYYQGVKKGHPNWRVFGIYLTPFGDTPSHEKYLPLDYTAVCNILDDVLEDTGLMLISDVKISIQHYTEMVRRNIVGDSNIARLCQQIYQKHKRALDLIYEHRPDLEGDIRYTLIQLIKNSKGLAYLGRHRNEYIYFRSRQWEVSALDAGNDPHGFFRFVFHNHFEELFLFLETSPGDETTRRRLYEMGQKNESLFNDLVDSRTNDYPKLYRRIFLTPEHFEEASDCEREREIRKQWDEFLGKDLPRIEEALKGEKWIWDPVEAGG